MLKKFPHIIAIITIIAFSFCPSALLTSAAETDIVYAYLKTDTILYDKVISPLSGVTYKEKTTLPQTYFVALLENESDSTDGYLLISYLDITGYVLISQIEIVDYEPVYKYAEPKLTLYFDGKTITLRESPDHTITPISTPQEIPSGTSVTYYGTVEGTAMFAPVGTTWYYVRYIQGSLVYYGYIYSAQALTIDPILPNVIEKVPKPQTPEPTDETPSPKIVLTPTTQTILILSLSIPTIIIMLLLFKSPQKTQRRPRE